MWQRLKVALLFVYHGIDSPQFRAAARAYLAVAKGVPPLIVEIILGLLEAMEADDPPAAVQAKIQIVPQGDTTAAD